MNLSAAFPQPMHLAPIALIGCIEFGARKRAEPPKRMARHTLAQHSILTAQRDFDCTPINIDCVERIDPHRWHFLDSRIPQPRGERNKNVKIQHGKPLPDTQAAA